MDLDFTVVWPCERSTMIERAGAIRGYTIGANGTPGFSVPMVQPTELCTMAYDIEVAMEASGSMPPIGHDILSICAKCTCGLEWCVYRSDMHTANVTSGHTHQPNNELMCVEFMNVVIRHRPVWLIGWNIAGFDNIHIEEALMGLE